MRDGAISLLCPIEFRDCVAKLFITKAFIAWNAHYTQKIKVRHSPKGSWMLRHQGGIQLQALEQAEIVAAPQHEILGRLERGRIEIPGSRQISAAQPKL